MSMEPFLTYITNVGSKIGDCSKLAKHLDHTYVCSKGLCSGRYKGFEIMLFSDGELRVSFPPSPARAAQLLAISRFLNNALLDFGIKADMSNALLNSRVLSGNASGIGLLFSNPNSARPTLGDKAHINIFRLYNSIGMHTAVNEKSAELQEELGKLLGGALYASIKNKSESLDDEEELFKFMQSNGIGLCVKLTPENDELARIRLSESISSAGMRPINSAICFFEKGLLKGFYEKKIGQEVEVKEVKCWGLGDKECEFVIRS